MNCASEFLDERIGGEEPWCCAVSFSEPNEALVCGRSAFERYDVDAIELPKNLDADFSNRPNLYQREQEITRNLSDDHWRMARACYYGCITEIDAQFGVLFDQLESADALENTVIILMADHGRYVGAHGFDAGFEFVCRRVGSARGDAGDSPGRICRVPRQSVSAGPANPLGGALENGLQRV